MMQSVAARLPVWRTSRYLVVRLPAEIDVANVDDMRESLLGLLNAGAASTVPLIVDLTGTTFCDSTAINMLIRAHTRAKALGCRMYAAVSPGGSVRRVFDVTAITRLIPTFDDVGSAIAAAVVAHLDENALASAPE